MMAELLLGSPLFPGESGVDQLVEIIKVGEAVGGDARVSLYVSACPSALGHSRFGFWVACTRQVELQAVLRMHQAGVGC